MPKEYINFPVATAFAYTPGEDASEPEPLPAASQVGIHWDSHGVVQISMDIDIEVLRKIVASKDADPDMWDGSEPGRQVFFTEALTRFDLQRLIKFARRSRDAAFGADE